VFKILLESEDHREEHFVRLTLRRAISNGKLSSGYGSLLWIDPKGFIVPSYNAQHAGICGMQINSMGGIRTPKEGR
jgi:hypothetical protein